jgi:hypothetical protein
MILSRVSLPGFEGRMLNQRSCGFPLWFFVELTQWEINLFDSFFRYPSNKA